MKTSKQFFRDHRSHELRRPGREFPDTPYVSSEGWRPTKGTAKCPKCNLEEEVLMSPDVICENHPRTEKIDLTCQKCGAHYRTKNISHIGARGLFAQGRDCDHDLRDLLHVCEADTP